jgi:hypothetical protein
MKTAFPCATGLAALTLALAVAAVPPPARAEPPAGMREPAPPPHASLTPYAHTALGALIEANGGKVPATGTQLTAALAKLGDFAQLPVTFSAVALRSGLSHPRVVLAMRQTAPPAGGSCPDMGAPPPAGWGSAAQAIAAIPLGSAAANKPYLHGRLFLAANTEPDDRGAPVIRTVEFISWNGRKQKFDFGVIEGMGGEPEVKLLDGVRCFSCHKNRGPILGASPWSNTAQNDLVRRTSAPLFKFAFQLDTDGKEDELRRRNDIDGLRFLMPNGPEVDAAVRQGAEVLRDRDRFRLLARTPEGRRALVLLLGGVAARGPLDAIDRKLKFDVNGLDLITFVQDAHAANKVLPSSTLADFTPVGAATKPGLGKAPAPIDPVTRYDVARAAGNHGLPSEHQPSNPKAFVRPPAVAPTNPSQLVSAVALARAVGLSEQDRTFLAAAVDEAVQKLNDPATTPAALARAVFTGASFSDVVKTGVLPERDDFKDRFAVGLIDALRARRKGDEAAGPFWHDRTKYASAPKFDPTARPEPDVEVLPSHACLRCHDVRTAAKPAAFNAIPPLAFDPFDATARDAWLATADRKRKVEVLGRMVKRLSTDKDMPPDDSTETELFRVKDPAALNAAKEWLDAELKKAK